jgi:hypothetical protein
MTDREREFLAMRRELVDPDFGDGVTADDIRFLYNRMKPYLVQLDWSEEKRARVLPANGADDRPAGNPADPEVQQMRPMGGVFLPEDDPDGEG